MTAQLAPYFPFPIADARGMATQQFQNYWQQNIQQAVAAALAAQQAQASADGAEQSAQAAQSSADNANTAAQGAQTTANTAISNSAAAQTTANTALANAATAQTTANTANTNLSAEISRATAAEALLAPKASPALTGSPTAPTAAAGTNTTQIATTAFVEGEIATFKSGTYTPTLTANTNVSASVSYSAQWMQIGKIVTVSGRMDITATAAGADTILNISLPVASTFTAQEQAAGIMASRSLGSESGVIHAIASGTVAQAEYLSANNANTGYYFTFTYRVLP